MGVGVVGDIFGSEVDKWWELFGKYLDSRCVNYNT